jgi:hypothetical protein
VEQQYFAGAEIFGPALAPGILNHIKFYQNHKFLKKKNGCLI